MEEAGLSQTLNNTKKGRRGGTQNKSSMGAASQEEGKEEETEDQAQTSGLTAIQVANGQGPPPITGVPGRGDWAEGVSTDLHEGQLLDHAQEGVTHHTKQSGGLAQNHGETETGVYPHLPRGDILDDREEGEEVHTHLPLEDGGQMALGHGLMEALLHHLTLPDNAAVAAAVAAATGNGRDPAEDASEGAAFPPTCPESDTWAPSIPETPPSSISPHLIPPFSLLPSSSSSTSSSFSPSPLLSPSLSPPLPEGTDVGVLLAGGHLALEVYKGGAAVLPSLWETQQERLMEVRYLRLGSEDQGAIERAVEEVVPSLTRLRSLAIRGHRFHDAQGLPLPGLLSSLPSSLCSLSLLVHLDLSFNRLSALPSGLFYLASLGELVLSCNLISSLPGEVGALATLQRLILLGNRLTALPPELGRLQRLRTLDVSANRLQALPAELGHMTGLRTLELSQNHLRELPASLASLSSLRELVVHSNDLRSVPESVLSLPHLSLDLRNNPIGRPPTPPPLPPAPPAQEDSAIPELHLGIHQHRFTVTAQGCHVFIPGGVELLFPRRCVASVTRLKWAEHVLDRKWVWLEEHDFLLSRPLELLPHGVSFEKPVEVCVPYRRVRHREVVVRRFDGQQWSTLPTLTRRGSQRHSSQPRGRPARLACCSVSEFSWFVAVARPVSDSCSVSPEGALLVSRADSGIKLRFPPQATTHTRTVTLQVLQVALSEVQALSGDLEARASPLLRLSQTPSMPFLQPITVQIPLPPGLTGHMVDKTRLHLLHRDSASHTWSDITTQVTLQVTHLYAIFTITHFSWYWLWYSTHKCISGVVRKVYHKLKQFRVQFLAQQKKTDPLQVLLQCLPACKVENRLEALCEVYDGPQPSEVCDLLEGEQFFAGFERGIDMDAERPDCVEGRLAFVFYSHLKNLKEVFICPGAGQQGAVRGQVSFYRGEVPTDLPVEVLKKRKGHDSQWMATLPIRLPAPGWEGGGMGMFEEREYPPLNLGDAESGYLTESNLLGLSLRIGHDWRSIGINLGISYHALDRMEHKHRNNLGALVLEMLFHWARAQQDEGAVPRLIDAMLESGRRDLAEEVEEIVSVGKRKYQASLKRVGLQEDTPPDSETQTSTT
ncbi:p53-induced death domain-containing protein 1 [Engraulis encrasicolus]|uniref:p53-induced death domain-containing protein 1 n=1 Tax=Engraulis encrasicolus TaxID=184585 RepID=UPI002FD428E9